jgi:hypothetical protein
MTDKRASEYERRQLTECLLAQAKLCERIAEQSQDEETAKRFRQMSKECKEAAKEQTEPSVQAVWPAVLAF